MHRGNDCLNDYSWPVTGNSVCYWPLLCITHLHFVPIISLSRTEISTLGVIIVIIKGYQSNMAVASKGTSFQDKMVVHENLQLPFSLKLPKLFCAFPEFCDIVWKNLFKIWVIVCVYFANN